MATVRPQTPGPDDQPPPAAEVDASALVGAAIRARRESAGLSMRALATRSGVSQPFLSQIENGQASPSMVTLYRIAGALGAQPGELLPQAPSTSVLVVRADEGQRLPVGDGVADPAIGRMISKGDDRLMEVVEYRINPRQHLGEWFQHDGENLVYLVSGRVIVELDAVGSWTLAPGDSVYHPGEVRHRWLLVGDEPAHVLLVVARAPS
jgi:transcriptional regulator with XRE-family HTH domain